MNDENKNEQKAEDVAEKANEAKDEAQKAEESADKAEEAKENVQETKEPARNASQSDAGGEKKDSSKAEQDKPKKEVQVSGKLGNIIKDIEGLKVLELSELVKALEEKFGVTAAAPIAVAGTAPAAGAEEAADEGQTTFNVVLTEGGANKISVIKAVRELVPTLGLKEAKDLVDGAPKQVLEGVGKDAANEAKQKLETAGGKVELK